MIYILTMHIFHFYNNIFYYKNSSAHLFLTRVDSERVYSNQRKNSCFFILKKWKKYMFVQQITLSRSLPMKNFSQKIAVHKKKEILYKSIYLCKKRRGKKKIFVYASKTFFVVYSKWTFSESLKIKFLQDLKRIKKKS